MKDREAVKQIALEAGFKLKKQPDGTMDLNPYVYEFAADLLEFTDGYPGIVHKNGDSPLIALADRIRLK